MAANSLNPQYHDLLGLPFLRGARGPRSYDCYGLCIEMFKRAGTVIPDFSDPGELEAIEELIRTQSAKWKRQPFGIPGTLITMRVRGVGAHVGYMLSEDRFIHAIEGTGVTTDRLSLPPFSDSVLAAYSYE